MGSEADTEFTLDIMDGLNVIAGHVMTSHMSWSLSVIALLKCG